MIGIVGNLLLRPSRELQRLSNSTWPATALARLVKKAQVVVDFGARADLILEYAAARRVDLIVMGLHSRGGIRARITAHLPGSTTYEVVSRGTCPVLTVPLPRKRTEASQPRNSEEGGAEKNYH